MDPFLASSGMTLVELMVALVILLFVSMALFQTAIVSIDANARTALRDEAVRLAEAKMDELKNRDMPAGTDFINGTATTYSNVSVPLRNMSQTYKVRAVVYGAANIMNVTVGWDWKGESFTHQVTTVRTD